MVQRVSTELPRFALLRVAGLPAREIIDLNPPETGNEIKVAKGCLLQAEALRSDAEARLYDLIPTIDDRGARGAAIRVKRDIHNQRLSKESDQQAVLAAASGDAHAVLSAWFNAVRAGLEHLARAEQSLEREITTHVRPQTWALLGDEHFRAAIALASPDLAAAIRRECTSPPKDSPAPSKLERTAIRYLCRAALKTSPFSTFTQIVPIELDPAQPKTALDFSGASLTTRVRINRGLIARLYHALLPSIAERDDEFAVNGTLRRLEPRRIEALSIDDEVIGGRPWRRSFSSTFQLHPEIADCLCTATDSIRYRDLLAILGDLSASPPQAKAILAHLLAKGLLLPTSFTDAYDIDPLANLDALLANRDSPEAGYLRGVIGQLAELERSCAAPNAERRLAATANIRELEHSVLARAGVAQKASAVADPVLEDAWLFGVTGAIGGDIAELLGSLRTWLGTQVVLKPEYVRMRAAFVEWFGRGGACTDVAGFAAKVAGLLHQNWEFGSLPKRDPSVPARDGTRHGVTVHFQIANETTEGHEQLLAVINRAYDGIGWTASRFAAGSHAGHLDLRDRLSEWIRAATAPREPIGMVFSGFCNELQVHPELTQRVLAWPAEPLMRNRKDTLDVRRLKIVHNPSSDMLEVLDDCEQPISLTYLGAALPQPIWGITYSMTVLAQPTMIARLDPAARLREAVGADGIDFQPRYTVGRLVLTRASWRVHARRLSEVWFRRSGAKRLLDVAMDCERHNIPEAFFVCVELDPSGTMLPTFIADPNMKPLWIDTRNPFSLDLLERLCKKTKTLVITEPLPRPDDAWVEHRGQRHAAELHVEMMLTR